jgi:CheY-like chemotaxis protein
MNALYNCPSLNQVQLALMEQCTDETNGRAMEPKTMNGRKPGTTALLPEQYAEAADPNNAPAGKYVLLVLFPYYNHLFGVNLLRAGLTVRWVESVDVAWWLMMDARPSVVVCWVGRKWFGRSKPDGIALLNRIHASEFADISTIAIVGERGTQEEATAAGASTALVVPFTPLELVHYIKQHIESH